MKNVCANVDTRRLLSMVLLMYSMAWLYSLPSLFEGGSERMLRSVPECGTSNTFLKTNKALEWSRELLSGWQGCRSGLPYGLSNSGFFPGC